MVGFPRLNAALSCQLRGGLCAMSHYCAHATYFGAAYGVNFLKETDLNKQTLIYNMVYAFLPGITQTTSQA